MHELLHALPGGLVVYSAAALGIGLVWPSSAPWIALPFLVYAALLGALTCEGLRALHDVKAVVAVPLCTLTLHFGYGVGYLAAWVWHPARTKRSFGGRISARMLAGIRAPSTSQG
jgi:hypothetical protein